MKIIKQTPTKLIVEHKIPLYLRILVWLIVSFMVTLAMSLIQRTTLNCQRIKQDEGTCQFNQEVFFMTTTETIKLQDLKSAEVETKYSGKNNEYTLILNTNQQKIVFDVFTSSSPGNPRLISEQINQFLRDKNQRSLDIEQDNRFYGTCILIFVLALTQVWLFVLGRTTLVLDKELNQMSFERSKLFWRKKSQYSLNEIQEVKLESYQDKFANSSGVEGYNHVVVVLSSGEIIPLNNNFERSEKFPIIDQIKEFLDNE